MPNLLTTLPGAPIAELAAQHLLDRLPPGARGEAVVFVPTRRSAVTMRAAFQQRLVGEASQLPRILPLADIEQALLTLLGPDAAEMLEPIPPAMAEHQQRYLLATQVTRFIAQRDGNRPTLDYALALADELMALHNQCARAGIALSPVQLHKLVPAEMAAHWKQSLDFLMILAQYWPAIEEAYGMTTAANREALLLEALAARWQSSLPDYPVYVVGSTASHEATSRLLRSIAELPMGLVILPGLDPHIPAEEWVRVQSGHPLFFIKQFLAHWPELAPADIALLDGIHAPHGAYRLWQQALTSTESIPNWHAEAPVDNPSIRLVPCMHVESEARAIALLMREALETPGKRTALITPDEGLMERVAAEMRRYGVTVDRLTRGRWAESDVGSLWLTVFAAMSEPERLMPLRQLLHHPLMQVDPDLLAQLEPYWHGFTPRRSGQLPRLPEGIRAHAAYPALAGLVRSLAQLAREEQVASQWLARVAVLISPWRVEGGAEEAVGELLETLHDADHLGPISQREMMSLLAERLDNSMRHGGTGAHPCIAMLTPVEARLQHVDRVILGSMTEAHWPGLPANNAWLNLAAQASLGLPPPSHAISLAAHDLLMFGSAPEVFLSWPAREGGSPTTRSRFIERLVTLLAIHGVPEAAFTAGHYETWASARDAAAELQPADAVRPAPPREQRPVRLPVSAVDRLLADPFAFYARYVLGLEKPKPIDAEAEASDFGSLTHRALQALTIHWNETGTPATEREIQTIADSSLREFSDVPATRLFWRTRLIRALEFVNGIEAERRPALRQPVDAEQGVEASLPLAEGDALTLHGRLDRLETSSAGRLIADYKTGNAPDKKALLAGEATQLMLYAMLLGDAAAVHALEYWRLPHAGTAGELTTVAYRELAEAGLPHALLSVLSAMRDGATPFLATPGENDDYSGISRYDEWAG